MINWNREVLDFAATGTCYEVQHARRYPLRANGKGTATDCDRGPADLAKRNSALLRCVARVRFDLAYCYARPFPEYLGFSSGLDFETKIMVKEDAPELLRKELSSPKWKPAPIGMSGVTDCYQPIERRLKLTRGCLEVQVEFRNPWSGCVQILRYALDRFA